MVSNVGQFYLEAASDALEDEIEITSLKVSNELFLSFCLNTSQFNQCDFSSGMFMIF